MALEAFAQFLLVFTRLVGLIASVPIFSHPLIPARVKGGLAALLALLYAPLSTGPVLSGMPTLVYFICLLKELALGLSMGFMVTILLGIVRVGGELMGLMMGFSFVNILDPTSEQEVSILGEFYHEIALLYFFALQGPGILVHALRDSFILLPLGLETYLATFPEVFFRIFASFFYLGIQFALPVVATMLVTEVSLGLIAKAVPQMNIFQVGFPLKIGIGVMVLVVGIPGVLDFLGGVYPTLRENLFTLARAVGGGA